MTASENKPPVLTPEQIVEFGEHSLTLFRDLERYFIKWQPVIGDVTPEALKTLMSADDFAAITAIMQRLTVLVE